MLKHNRGYTLVEMLVATVLTLMMMSAVVGLFDSVGRGISNSRALLDTNDRLRMAARQLQRDLGGVTVTMSPPRRPEDNEGYFEYTEGPIGPVVRPEAAFVDSDAGNVADTTVIDNDDMLMMTVRSEEPFVGRHGGNNYLESNYAEVAWFVRGRTLYRRVLLIVAPTVTLGAAAGFYANNDVSVRVQGGVPVANTLGDLTKPENRFAHQPLHKFGPLAADIKTGFPFHPHFPIDWDADKYGGILADRTWARLGLPTHRECSFIDTTDGTYTWRAGGSPPNSLSSLMPLSLSVRSSADLWQTPHYWKELDPETGTLQPNLAVTTPDYHYAFLGEKEGATGLYPTTTRIAEDVVLTNVIGFDVKAWDPGAPIVMYNSTVFVPGDPGYLYALFQGGARIGYGAYVDLNYMCLMGGTSGSSPTYTPSSGAPTPLFHGAGQARSGLRGTEPFTTTSPVRPSANSLSQVLNRANFPADNNMLRDAVYDTWSLHYEGDGVQQFPNAGYTADTFTNGLDDDSDYVIDNYPKEAETLPPYPVPLRGIQITIRVYEPSTRQVRQRTIQQDFLAR